MSRFDITATGATLTLTLAELAALHRMIDPKRNVGDANAIAAGVRVSNTVAAAADLLLKRHKARETLRRIGAGGSKP